MINAKQLVNENLFIEEEFSRQRYLYFTTRRVVRLNIKRFTYSYRWVEADSLDSLFIFYELHYLYSSAITSKINTVSQIAQLTISL